jgi:glycosyltransferase involved in cell wall biosynthesis
VVVGWIGTWSTAGYLELVKDALSRVAAGTDVSFLFCGSENLRRYAEMLPRAEYLAWSPGAEVDFLSRIDIGLMPVPASEWESGKCGYKLIQYMSAGVPFVASPIGVNKAIAYRSEAGFLCETAEDWEVRIRELACDPDVRLRMGRRGRTYAAANYDYRVWEPLVVGLVKEAGGRG